MAESPAHQFGQYLGYLLEALLLPELVQFAEKYGVYVDKHGDRPARSGKKVTWVDKFGNRHDLDFVVERGGSATQVGRPLAFIEAAWRRYTKHSKNKAQEIQGAVLPLSEKFYWDRPFLGAFLAGHFTPGSLNQLASLGFNIVYISYENYVAAFASCGIDIRFDELTEDSKFSECMAKITEGGAELEERVISELAASSREEIDAFLEKLHNKLMRYVESITIVVLYGSIHEFSEVESAIKFVSSYHLHPEEGEFRGFEAIIKYSNADRVEGRFGAEAELRKFLEYSVS